MTTPSIANCPLASRRQSVFALTAISLACPPLHAQQAEPLKTSPDKLETVVITAQKRLESPQEVPIAVKALSSVELQKQGVTTAEEIAKTTTSLSWAPSGGVGSSVGIRGVVDLGFTTNQVGSVGIAVDEVGLNSPVVNSFALFDLERVEVLKGPQTTLYGRSTTAGAVNFVTVRPNAKDGTNGSISTTLGSFNRREFDSALGFALSKDSALRVAVNSQKRDGIFTNPDTGSKLHDIDRTLARLSFAAKPSADLDIFASVHAGRDRGTGQPYKGILLLDSSGSALCRSITTRAVPNSDCYGLYGDRDSASYKENFSNFTKTRNDIDASGGVLNVGWNAMGLRFTSVTGAERNSLAHSEDTDGSRADIINLYIDARTRQISQEFRVASGDDRAAFRWLAGAFYMSEKQDGILGITLPFIPIYQGIAFDQKDTIKSAYAQLDFDFTPQWSIVAGGRYSTETKSGLAENQFADDARRIPGGASGAYITPALARSIANPSAYLAAPYNKTWNNWGGKIGLNFKPQKDVMLYGSLSKGFKGGTFDFSAAAVQDPTFAAIFQNGVNPEKLTAVELGFKSRLADGRAELNGSVFSYKFKDQQLAVVVGANTVLKNAASSSIHGAEVDAKWVPAAGWLTQLSLGWLDGKYDAFEPDPGISVSGGPMMQTPKTTVSALIRREWSFDQGQLFAQLTASYRSAQWFGVRQNYPVSSPAKEYATLVPASVTLDARVGYTFGTNLQYSVTAYVKNLTDKRYFTFVAALPSLGFNQATANEPRNVGVRLAYEF